MMLFCVVVSCFSLIILECWWTWALAWTLSNSSGMKWNANCEPVGAYHPASVLDLAKAPVDEIPAAGSTSARTSAGRGAEAVRAAEFLTVMFKCPHTCDHITHRFVLLCSDVFFLLLALCDVREWIFPNVASQAHRSQFKYLLSRGKYLLHPSSSSSSFTSVSSSCSL